MIKIFKKFISDVEDIWKMKGSYDIAKKIHYYLNKK